MDTAPLLARLAAEEGAAVAPALYATRIRDLYAGRYKPRRLVLRPDEMLAEGWRRTRTLEVGLGAVHVHQSLDRQPRGDDMRSVGLWVFHRLAPGLRLPTLLHLLVELDWMAGDGARGADLVAALRAPSREPAARPVDMAALLPPVRPAA